MLTINSYIISNYVQVLERSYPKDAPKVEPPQFNKQMVYENNCHVFEQVSKINESFKSTFDSGRT